MIISTRALAFIDTVHTYLARLSASDAPGMAALFSPVAQIHSPFLGIVAPRPFFETLVASSRRSTAEDADVFVNAGGARRAIALFTYRWELVDGTELRFQCADVFDFDEDGLIERLTIVYDTAPIRERVGDKYRR